MPKRLLNIALMGTTLGLAAALAGCNRKATAEGPGVQKMAEVPVEVAPVSLRPVQRSVEIIGTLWGDEDAVISAKVAGRIASIHKDVGDRVESGQELAQIDPVDHKLEVEAKELAVREPLTRLGLSELPGGDFDATQVPTVVRAKLQAENARAKYLRGKQLHDQKPPLLSDQDFADLETAFYVAQSNYDVELLTAKSTLATARSAQADLEIAKQKLADTVIRAPGASGPARMYAIASRSISIGEYVKEGAPAFRVVDDDPVKLKAQVPERHARVVATGQAVELAVEAYPDTFTGRVSRISPQVDPASRAFQVEILIDNPDRRLKPGAFARGRILTHQEEGVVFVPREAVVTFVGIDKVFTVGKDNKAVEHKVELGARAGNLVEVKGGLKPVDRVVVNGGNRLAQGVPVTLRAATTRPATRPAGAKG